LETGWKQAGKRFETQWRKNVSMLEGRDMGHRIETGWKKYGGRIET
jgi:hypothetical protein